MTEIRKFYVSYQSRNSDNYFDTYEDAEARLKIKANAERDGDQWVMYQTVARAEMPVPDVKIIKI